ncbi:FtsW/RodA/SpoVE family cell cycle protein [Euhalothece natronophila Z-M001]|uniref:Probable peptidoglycan glycosyltransferase FtsW n=1 Tax=Euhalothece natronophila Z-M001 TaxID=522448 RepID=A0A5B8NQY4_9CHRO|nr:FtsW/RodA/SpoVE family cell cycle protein [Euhalothece natronophila Z-M001]
MLKYLIPIFNPTKSDWAPLARIIHWLTLLWLFIGLVVLFSASYPEGGDNLGNGLYYIKRQLIWAYPGLILFNVVSETSLKKLLKITPIVVLILFAAIIATNIWGVTINGAQRWLGVGTFLIQPSELIKPFLVLQGAIIFSQWHKSTIEKRIFWLVIFALILGGILMQPNLSNAALCGITLWLIALMGMIRWRDLGIVALIGISLGVISIQFNQHQLQRVMSFRDPWENISGDGYQLAQSLIAIGSGGTWGSGLGFSNQKLFYLPIQYTDFIFAVFAEEFGFVGCIALLLLIMSWATVGVLIAIQSQTTINRLIAGGAIIFMVGQSLINIAVATGAFPTTGLTFPLFSYGGNSVLASLFLAALLIRVARESNEGTLLEFPQPSQR